MLTATLPQLCNVHRAVIRAKDLLEEEEAAEAAAEEAAAAEANSSQDQLMEGKDLTE